MLPDTRNKKIYVLGIDISTVFKIEHSCSKGKEPSRNVMTYIHVPSDVP
jgi:hypothetical protein